MSSAAAGPWQTFADAYYAGTAAKRRVDADRERYSDRWDQLLDMGDAPAARLAAAIIERRVSRADFEATLTGGTSDITGAPEEIAEFLAPQRALPGCLDPAAIARGAEIFRRLPMPAWITHGVIAGFTFAAIYPNSALTLALNEAIIESTHKRYVETAKYVHDLLIDPLGDNAFRTACRVRLVHGFVRHEVTRHLDWNTDRYGTPIHLSAVLIAAAVNGSWAVPILERKGYRLTAQDKDDIAMFTAYQAFLQGVPEQHLLTTHEAYSDFLYYAISSCIVPLTEDRPAAERVLRPLVANGYPISASPAVNDLFNAYVLAETRRCFGAELCDAWGIHAPAAGWVMTPIAAVLNGVFGRARRLRLTRPLCDKLADAMVYTAMPQMVERVTGYREVVFDTAAKPERASVGSRP